ncbi:MAG: phosphatase PAP2 family protein [Planctomycetia bacterium]|nr:phosphatase PAP2 family protein [Planctomycetia bacterium]
MKLRIIFFSFILLLIPVTIFWGDKPISLFLKSLEMEVFFGHWNPPATEIDSRIPLTFRELFTCIDILGNTIGVFLFLGLCCMVSKKCYQHFPLLIFGVLGAGAISHIIKKCVVRIRPYAFDFSEKTWHSFDGFSFLQNSGEISQSFPSGHTTLAVAAIIFLTWLFPHGKWCFYTLGLWLILYRIAMGAHYLSDTLAGILVGGIFAYLCIFLWEKFFQTPENA